MFFGAVLTWNAPRQPTRASLPWTREENIASMNQKERLGATKTVQASYQNAPFHVDQFSNMS